jgi:hypothetical protein
MLPPGTVAGPIGQPPPCPVSVPVARRSCMRRPRASRSGRCRPGRARPPHWPHVPPCLTTTWRCPQNVPTPRRVAYKARPSPPHPPFPFHSQLRSPEHTHPTPLTPRPCPEGARAPRPPPLTRIGPESHRPYRFTLFR